MISYHLNVQLSIQKLSVHSFIVTNILNLYLPLSRNSHHQSSLSLSFQYHLLYLSFIRSIGGWEKKKGLDSEVGS